MFVPCSGTGHDARLSLWPSEDMKQGSLKKNEVITIVISVCVDKGTYARESLVWARREALCESPLHMGRDKPGM